MNDDMRKWTCEHGHVMGMAGRNGSGITQLWIYRNAIDLNDEEPEAPELLAIGEGFVFDIRCSICGSTRTWVPGEEALNRLLERLRKTGIN